MDLRNLTVSDLKDLCSSVGLTGYSALRKEDLIQLIEQYQSTVLQKKPKDFKELTVAELKKLCFVFGITGVSSLKKDELIETLLNERKRRKKLTATNKESAAIAKVGDLRSLTVADLKELCSSLGISGYSAMRKEELIQVIEQHETAHLVLKPKEEKEHKVEVKESKDGLTTGELRSKTVAQLKEMCSSMGISGYSALKKEEIIQLIEKHYASANSTATDTPIDLRAKTVAELKEMCSSLGLSGYSALRKEDIINLLEQNQGKKPKETKEISTTKKNKRGNDIVDQEEVSIAIQSTKRSKTNAQENEIVITVKKKKK